MQDSTNLQFPIYKGATPTHLLMPPLPSPPPPPPHTHTHTHSTHSTEYLPMYWHHPSYILIRSYRITEVIHLVYFNGFEQVVDTFQIYRPKNPPQLEVWGHSEKIAIIWRNLIHTKLLQMTKEFVIGQRLSALYIYVCIFIVLTEYQGWSIQRLWSGFASV